MTSQSFKLVKLTLEQFEILTAMWWRRIRGQKKVPMEFSHGASARYQEGGPTSRREKHVTSTPKIAIKINLLGCLSYEKGLVLTYCVENMNGLLYAQLLDKFIAPFISEHSHPTQMLFLQDNARFHTCEGLSEAVAGNNIKLEPDLHITLT